jgi:hypothetical protein
MGMPERRASQDPSSGAFDGWSMQLCTAVIASRGASCPLAAKRAFGGLRTPGTMAKLD